MGKAKELLDVISPEPIDSESIINAFDKKISDFGLEDQMSTVDVSFEDEGEIQVTFSDSDDELYSLLFSYDQKDGPQAFSISAEDNDEDESDELVADLDLYNPAVVATPSGSYMNLSDLSWMDADIFSSLMQIAGFDVDLDDNGSPSKTYDAFGNIYKNEDICEVYLTRVVGGKKVRVQAVRRVQKRRLTPKQRAGIRKAVAKRKREKNLINRHRAKSLAVRKRLHIKSSKLPKGFRVKR